MQLDVLKSGSSEGLKMGVHATALGLAIVMGVYNAAAWLRRRESHLAVNAVLYTALTAWEKVHVAHHLAARRALQTTDDVVVIVVPGHVADSARRVTGRPLLASWQRQYAAAMSWPRTRLSPGADEAMATRLPH